MGIYKKIKIQYFAFWNCWCINKYMIKTPKIAINFYEAHLFWIVFPFKRLDIFYITIK
jgi:hypothetical protein